ncbi:MAG: phosphatidylserine decarboxylase, partial [Lachnospirales bacterium]
KFMDSGLSVSLIKPFIYKNNIDLNDFKIENWKSFNEFFTRRIKPQSRPIDTNRFSFIAPCDGLLTVYNSSEPLLIKGVKYSLLELLKDKKLAEEYKDGKCLIYRLTPSHYHRYCYIDKGIKSKNRFIPGILHTVQPIGLENAKVFKVNSREYTLLRTVNFGDIIQMEVGALFVGRIVNYHEKHKFLRGEEKGRFEFGGSTIVVLTKKNAVEILPEILECNGEYSVKMGQAVGFKGGLK